MKLYIIGNGFDLAHNLPTRYSDFKEYVRNHNAELFSELNNIYGENDLWSDFEKALGHPNKEYIDKPDKVFGIKNIIGREFANDIKNELGSWISTIKYNFIQKQFDLSDEDLYLSFNYTDTLNAVYRINDKRIKFIHGFVAKHFFGEHLIIGHNNNCFDGYELIENTYKDTDLIIKQNKEWFDKLLGKRIKNIIVIGCSYNDIDIVYFKEIKKRLPNANWKLTVKTKNDEKQRDKYIKDLEITNN